MKTDHSTANIATSTAASGGTKHSWIKLQLTRRTVIFRATRRYGSVCGLRCAGGWRARSFVFQFLPNILLLDDWHCELGTRTTIKVFILGLRQTHFPHYSLLQNMTVHVLHNPFPDVHIAKWLLPSSCFLFLDDFFKDFFFLSSYLSLDTDLAQNPKCIACKSF